MEKVLASHWDREVSMAWQESRRLHFKESLDFWVIFDIVIWHRMSSLLQLNLNQTSQLPLHDIHPHLCWWLWFSSDPKNETTGWEQSPGAIWKSRSPHLQPAAEHSFKEKENVKIEKIRTCKGTAEMMAIFRLVQGLSWRE